MTTVALDEYVTIISRGPLSQSHSIPHPFIFVAITSASSGIVQHTASAVGWLETLHFPIHPSRCTSYSFLQVPGNPMVPLTVGGTICSAMSTPAFSRDDNMLQNAAELILHF